MKGSHYDGIVIGSGQGGTPLAIALAKAGWKMALVERSHIGGTCVNVGCTPTKTMVASARVASLVARANSFGVNAGRATVDIRKIRERKRNIVDSFRSGSEKRVERTVGLTLVRGEAEFTGRNSLRVNLNEGGQEDLTGDKIFINAGCRPARPNFGNTAAVPMLDSTSITELDNVPEHLVILGGGYVGLEFGQMFRRFGSDVTIVQHGKQLLSREDPDIAEAVASILRADGIELMLDSMAKKVEMNARGQVEVTVRTQGSERKIPGTHVLSAVGRVPNTEDLGLPAAGIEVDTKGFIRVDEHLQTNIPDIYALGDVKGGPAFTHISYDDYRILKTNLLQGSRNSTAGRLVPYTVFIDPPLGRVGTTETEARGNGLDIRIATMPMSYIARALETDETHGLMKAVVEATTGQILGAAVLGTEGGEIMSILQTAMMGHLPYTKLRDAVYAHPTLAESLNNLFSSIGGG